MAGGRRARRAHAPTTDGTTLHAGHPRPPEPLERVLTTIAGFQLGDTLKILSNFEPTPLYRILERDGFRRRVESGADATFEITVWSDS